MRRIFSIGFLLLYLGLFTELHQVLRLPILVQHFIEHRSMVPEMSFMQFLTMHYKTDTPHDSTDMELPFKDCSNSVATPSFSLPEQKIMLAMGVVREIPAFFSFYFSFVPASYLAEIFQPPRA